MDSAGQNNHFENVPRQYIDHDKENIWTSEQINKENVHPVHAARSKYSTGALQANRENIQSVKATKSRYSSEAVLKINQNKPRETRYSTGSCYAERYACDTCPSNSKSNSRHRQPLSELHLNRTHRAEDFKRPALVSKSTRHTGAIVRRTISLNENPSTSTRSYSNRASNRVSRTPVDLNPTANSTKKVVNEEPSDDSGFWTSFLSVDGTVNGPHKKVQKFVRNSVTPRPNTFNANQSIIHDSIPSVRKKTLKRQVSHHSGYFGVVNLDPYSNPVHPVVLYSVEYVNDMTYNILVKQEQNILKSRFLDKSNTFLDSRASVINWLIKLHQFIPSEASVFFMSVRMFDKILTLLDISESSYQLIAMATYWISLKYINSANYITGPKLVKLCNNAFSLENLLEMERNVLLYLHFDIIFDDPIILVNYFIYILRLYESNIIGFCANYLLEILTLDFNCNTYSLSLQASSAVFLSMKFFEIQDKVWKMVENYHGYHNTQEMYPLHKIMLKNIILINHEDCPYKESLQKYSTEKYGKVSVIIPQLLQKWYNDYDISLLIS